MGKRITKSLGGRPTKYGEEVVKKLDSIFKVGGTVDEACSYAGITKPTYYDWIEQYPDFLTKMEAAKHYSDIVAKNVVVEAITKDRDLGTAKWWLEKREFKDKSGGSVQTVIIMPPDLMNKYGGTIEVSRSTSKDSTE